MSTTISDLTGNVLGEPEKAQVVVRATELGKDPPALSGGEALRTVFNP